MIKKIWVPLVLLSLWPIMALPEEQKDPLVQELYVKSGMEKQLAQWPHIIQASFDRAKQEDARFQMLPQNIISAMGALIPEAFALEGIKKIVLGEIGKNLTHQDIKHVLEWLDSPLGKKCTQLEEDATKPEVVAALALYAAQIKKSPPSPERLTLIKKLDSATKCSENAAQMSLSTAIAFALALNATLPKELQKSPDKLTREMEKMASKDMEYIKNQTFIFLLYAYRELNEEQINQYIKFLMSPAGSKYMTVTMGAMKEALLKCGFKWGQAMGERIQQLGKESGV